MYPAHPSSMYPPYHNNYSGQPAPGYQWTAGGYPGQMPSSGYPGPPCGPVYPGQPPGRPCSGINNEGLQLQSHPMNSMPVSYQQFNSSTPGGTASLLNANTYCTLSTLAMSPKTPTNCRRNYCRRFRLSRRFRHAMQCGQALIRQQFF